MRHIQVLLRRMETYLELCVTLACTTVSYSEYKASSKACGTCKVKWSCIFKVLAQTEQFTQAFSRIFRHIQGYWSIFSHTHRRATRGRGGGEGRPPLVLLEIEKCPDSWKKDTDWVHLEVKFSIQNVVLRVSTRKTPKCSPTEPLFLVFLMKSLRKCPSSTNLPLLPWKFSGCVPALGHYSFCKTVHLKCLTVLWIRICYDNCSVICTVTLYYVLHQTHLKFWHIQDSVFSGSYEHIQSYSALLRHTHAHWNIILAYSCLFRNLCNPRIFTTLSYSELI